MDALLLRAGPPSDLLPDEWQRMRELLIERYQNTDDPQIDLAEREVAFIYPFVVKIAREEYDAIQHEARG